METFLLTLRETALFLVFFGVGILLSRFKILPANAGMTLSRLITWVFLPALGFDTFARQFTVGNIGSYALLLAAGCAVVLLSVPVSMCVRKRLPGTRLEKMTAVYSMVVPNFAYFGYPLVLALFGQKALSQFMMFALPVNFYVYGYAMPQWMPETDKTSFFRRTFSAPLIGLLLGAAFGLTGLPYPSFVSELCTSASAGMGVCAMIVAGLAIGKLKLRSAWREKRAYAVTGIRLVLLPLLFIAAAFGLCTVLRLDSALLLTVGVYVSLPLGLNPVVFSETYGEDGSFGAVCALISMLLCLITLPLTVSLLVFLSARL